MKKISMGPKPVPVTGEMPSDIERRLVLRLLSYWRTICHDRNLPSFTNVDLSDLPDIRPHSFAIEMAGDGAAPNFVSVGAQLATYCDKPLIGRLVSEVPGKTLLGVAVSYIGEMLDKCAPVSRGGEIVTTDGTKLLYRSILLPMSDDGETISGILGAANCRAISDKETVKSQRDEV